MNVKRKAPQTLEVINIGDADTTCFGHLTPISSTVHGIYTTFGGSSLTVRTMLERTCTMATCVIRAKETRRGGASSHLAAHLALLVSSTRKSLSTSPKLQEQIV